MFLSKVWCRSWLPANSRVDLIFKFIEFVSSCEFCVWSKFRFRRESKWISDNSRYLKWPWIENSMSMVSNSEMSCLFFQSLNYIEFIKWCQEFSVTKYKSTNLMNSIFIIIECIQKSNANKNESPDFLQLEQNWEWVKALLMTGLQVMKKMCHSFLHWELMETRPNNFASQNSFRCPCSHRSKMKKDDWAKYFSNFSFKWC